MVTDILEFYHQSPKQFIGGIAMVFITIIALYLFLHERYLRKHLDDLQPDRRVLFLIHQWQLRNFQIIFGMVLVATLLVYIYPNQTKIRKPKGPQEITSPITKTAPTASTDHNPDQPAQQHHTIVTNPQAVLDLFDNGNWHTDDDSLNELKTAYENALIGGYILHNCKRSSETEIRSLLEILREAIIDHQEKAPKNQYIDGLQLYSNIVSAAEGSYEMVYRRTECDAAEIDMLEQQFAHFLMHHKAQTQPTEPALSEGKK